MSGRYRGPIRSISGVELGRRSANFGRCRAPELVDPGPSLVDTWRIWPNIGRTRPNFGRLTSGQIGQFGRSVAPKVVKSAIGHLHSIDLDPVSVDFGPESPKFGCGFDQTWTDQARKTFGAPWTDELRGSVSYVRCIGQHPCGTLVLPTVEARNCLLASHRDQFC